jgi:hypothetical protein
VNDSEVQPTKADLDSAYRERAHLLAYLAATQESCLSLSDPAAPDWPVLTVETPAGQMCWHIAPRDLDLFGHVPNEVKWRVPAWDGHSTAEKYERLRKLVSDTAH